MVRSIDCKLFESRFCYLLVSLLYVLGLVTYFSGLRSLIWKMVIVSNHVLDYLVYYMS